MKRQKTERKEHWEADKRLISDLMHDANMREVLLRDARMARHPMSVWNESDQEYDLPRLTAQCLPRWRQLTETMKAFLGWDVGMEFGCAYPFGAHVAPALFDAWMSSKKVGKNIEQRLRRELNRIGLHEVPICYVVEGRSRSGKTRTRVHLHGYALCEDPYSATKLKIALERAFNPRLLREGRTREVWVKPAYRETIPYLKRGTYPLYIVKNAHRYDARFAGRRIYFNQPLTEIVREAWAVRREE